MNTEAPPAITIWLDPVCPYSWSTAQWLRDATGDTAAVRWEQMSLAILNEGRDLPERARARMRDSRTAGRLFARLSQTLDHDRRWEALRAFTRSYHEDGRTLDDELVAALQAQFGGPVAQDTTDESLDAAVLESHIRSQDAAGGTGGSPLIDLGGKVFHGPVLTAVPEPTAGRELLAALDTLAAVDAFASVQRLHPASTPPSSDRKESERE
ncbi:DsbA family protein [Tsukamurella strandjordii]|uniref:DsbA family protein n=1 Tax=Tsukamurella strandjordii TaxID=147577 RepID=A0AA90NJT4_9ACTN|nr:DsbA family protein [Tsukamurella strandjordii]MDP0400065.1 DsbA family protein [Tsukamurella strandjordii]